MTITIKATNTRKTWGERKSSGELTEDEELAMLMSKLFKEDDAHHAEQYPEGWDS